MRKRRRWTTSPIILIIGIIVTACIVCYLSASIEGNIHLRLQAYLSISVSYYLQVNKMHNHESATAMMRFGSPSSSKCNDNELDQDVPDCDVCIYRSINGTLTRSLSRSFMSALFVLDIRRRCKLRRLLKVFSIIVRIRCICI